MSAINGVGNNSPVQKIVQQAIQKEIPADAPPIHRSPVVDKLELSGMSHLLKALKANQDLRVDKIQQIKSQIAAESYEDDHKLDIAADRLLDELNK